MLVRRGSGVAVSPRTIHVAAAASPRRRGIAASSRPRRRRDSSEEYRYERVLKARCGGDDPALRRQARTTDALKTVGVMPFYAAGRAGAEGHRDFDSNHGQGSGHTRYESKALYLNITIRSIRCHFGAVAVSALDAADRASVRRADLSFDDSRRRGCDVSVETSRGDAAAATWMFRGSESRRRIFGGDESRRRRRRDVDSPWRRVAAAPRPRRGCSVETTPLTDIFGGDESRRRRGRDVDSPWT